MRAQAPPGRIQAEETQGDLTPYVVEEQQIAFLYVRTDFRMRGIVAKKTWLNNRL